MRDDALARIIELEANATYAPSKGDPRIGELEGQLAQVCQERDEALEGMGQARAELDQYRAAAAAALEPLGQEYTRAMRELLAESDSMIAHLRKHASETSQRTEELLQLVESRMNERVRSVRNQMEERLMQIIGTPPEQAMDQMPPVDDTTATKTAAETAA
jgi:chromatin segregation and condensation protein Rec8/ScpA/Scc1 (kleisin family)